MVNQFKRNPLNARLITMAALAVFIFLITLLEDHPAAVERYYSRGLYPVICHVFHFIFNLFPFSIGDIIYVLAIIGLIYLVFRFVRMLIRRQWKPAVLLVCRVTIGVQVSIITFYVFWGMNYYRPSAAERLNLGDSTYNVADLKAVTAMLIDSANVYRQKINQADLSRTNKSIYETAVKAVKKLDDGSPNFKAYDPGIKSSLITPLLNYLGTSGYYNPFTSESQVNYEMPVFVRPFVACHELSHQMGYGPEDEANFVGFIAATHSDDNFFRYSAYYLGVQEFMYTLRSQDSLARKELRKRISPAVLSDFKAERQYWLSYEGKLESVSSFFYDNFLKANNQPEGLKTYNRMVLLVLAYRKKHPL
jgi:hypothetical protein